MEYRRPYTITRPRVILTVLVVLLCVVGALLPYLTLGYVSFASEPIRPTHHLFGTISMINKMDISYIPAARTVGPNPVEHGIDLLMLGAVMQAVGLIGAIVTVAGQFMNEINKFLWWPYLVCGALLVLGPVAVLIADGMLSHATVDVAVRFGWIPLFAAGVVVLVSGIRSRSRLDRYRGV